MPDDDTPRDPVEDVRETFLAIDPPPELEERVVASLRKTRAMTALESRESASPSWRRLAAGVAVAVVSFLAGHLLPPGLFGPLGDTEPGHAYVLLLRESSASGPGRPAEIARLVDEYRNWADRMRRAGVLLRGEKLETGGVELRPAGDGFDRRAWSPAAGFVGGYFVVRARSYEEAAEIAGTCPHLRYGGTIEIRRIEET